MKTLRLIIIALAVNLALTTGHAATYTWTGAGFFGNQDFLWSNPNNWQGLAAPQNGEQGVQLVFPNTGAPRNTTNDVLNLVLSSVTFQGANYNLYGFGANGTTMTLLGAGGGDFAIVAAANNCQFAVNTRLHFGSMGVIGVAGGNTFTIKSRLSGVYGFTKSSPGTLNLQGSLANTFTGTTTVRDGTLNLRNAGLALPGALVIGDGNASHSPSVVLFLAEQIGDTSPVTVRSNGELLFADVNETFGNLTLVGGFVDTANATLKLNGNVLVQSPTNGHPSDVRGAVDLGIIGRFFTVESNAVLDISAVISGGAFGNAPAGVHKNGPGRMNLGGFGNTFGGSLFVSEGSVSFSNGAQLGAATNTTGVASNATLVLGQVAFGPVVNGRKLSLTGGARMQTPFDSEWNGPIQFHPGKAIFDITQTNATLILGGTLIGEGGFEKTGLGELVLGGPEDNAFTGVSDVQAGRLSLRKVGINTNKLAITGPLIIGQPGTSTNSPKVVVERSEVIAAPVIVNFNGSLLLSNAVETIDSLAVNAGWVAMDGASTLNLGGTLASTNSVIREGLIQGKVNLGSASVVIRVQDYPLNLAAIVSGQNLGRLTKVGGGQLRLTAANTYLGDTSVMEGRLAVEHSLALSDSTTVSNGATLMLVGPIDLPNTTWLYLAGDGVNGTEGALRSIGANILRGHVFLQGSARFNVVGAGGLLTVKDSFLATQGFVKSGPGVMSFKPDGSPETVGDFGPTDVLEGELWLNRAFNSAAETVIHDGLFIGGDAGHPPATVRVLNRRQLTDGSKVRVNATGRIYFSPNTTNSFTALEGNGLVDVSANSRIQLGGDADETYEFAGMLQGGGVNETNVRKLGLSTFILSGPNNLLGTTEVYGGAVWVNSQQPTSRFNLTSGTLGGTGLVATVKMFTGSRIAPGSPLGSLRVTSCTTLGSNALSIDFSGPVPGTGDQLELDSQPNLSSTRLFLNIGPGFNPSVGQRFTILKNNHAGSVLGSFVGLPDGTEWRPVPTLRYRISYNAGDGNDVVLTTLEPPAPSQVNQVI